MGNQGIQGLHSKAAHRLAPTGLPVPPPPPPLARICSCPRSLGLCRTGRANPAASRCAGCPRRPLLLPLLLALLLLAACGAAGIARRAPARDPPCPDEQHCDPLASRCESCATGRMPASILTLPAAHWHRHGTETWRPVQDGEWASQPQCASKLATQHEMRAHFFPSWRGP